MAYEEIGERVGGPYPKKDKKNREKEVKERGSMLWGRVGGPLPK